MFRIILQRCSHCKKKRFLIVRKSKFGTSIKHRKCSFILTTHIESVTLWKKEYNEYLENKKHRFYDMTKKVIVVTNFNLHKANPVRFFKHLRTDCSCPLCERYELN